MILVDTSVWIDHLRKASGALADLLEREEVLVHPFVIGELACGAVKNRDEVLTLLNALPRAVVATHDEVMQLIERRRLMGRGLGYVDAHLLASAMLTESTRLLTHDKALQAAANELRVA